MSDASAHPKADRQATAASPSPTVPPAPVTAPAPVRLGFARGIAPSKWANRWAQAVPGIPLELVPLAVSGRPDPREAPLDVVLERVAPGTRPEGSTGDVPTRHAVRLYAETIALVVPAEHELAEAASVDRDALDRVTLLGHPAHSELWPDAQPWADPAWAPKSVPAALELVATGLGGILLPHPLARHLTRKGTHAVVPLTGDERLPGTEIWATWAVERDAGDVQQLVGIMRGRTARSDRPGAVAADPQGPKPVSRTPQRQPAKKPQLPKNSRGAQLAAAKEKREAAKRARAQQKKRGR